MNLRDKTNKVRYVRKKLGQFFDHMCQIYGGDAIIDELMQLRGYYSPEMRNMLKRIGVYEAGSGTMLPLIHKDYTPELLRDFGLYSAEDDYHMEGRFVLPIRDIRGDIVALVGWDRNGGSRKYLTTQTYGFHADASFFNYDIATREAWTHRDGKIIIVEGIFDALALTSVGFPAMADMGLKMSYIKSIMLSRYKAVITITDNDSGGRKTVPYLYTAEMGVSDFIERKKEDTVWKPKAPTTYARLPEYVKDSDVFVRDYAMEEELEKVYTAKKFIQLE